MSERTWHAYERWAASYDTDPNPQIILEEESVLREVNCQPGVAILDAGCGTGRYSGRLVPTETTTADDLYRIDGRFAIEAGTGRFAGATGGGLASGLQNLTTGEASVVLDGIITYPGMTPAGVDTTRFQQP